MTMQNHAYPGLEETLRRLAVGFSAGASRCSMGEPTTTALRAFHGDAALRARTIAEMEAHAAADCLVQGMYWDCGRGCAVGCLTHDPRGGHEQFPVRWGIPEVLARLEDRIFEGLLPEEARAWPVRFLSAIPLGADLSGVWPRFAVALLSDEQRGVRRLTREGSAQRAGVNGVVELYLRVIGGGVVADHEWKAAASSASAAALAADDAAYAAASSASAAALAAADAAYAAASSASAAALAAADAGDASSASAAADAARRAHFSWLADMLLRLLAEAPCSSS